MKLYVFEPYDVLSFGGLRHFAGGETHVQKSAFPPPIMRFFHIFERVYGVFLYKDGKVYIPLPADVVKERKKEDKPNIKILKLNERGIPLLTGVEGAYEQAREYFISLKDFFTKYAKGQGDFSICSLRNFIQKEQRVGISIDKDTRTAKDRFLYSQDFLRFSEGSRIGVLAEGLREDIRDNRVFLGGERRVSYMHSEDLKVFEKPVSIQKGKLYKFYVLSHLFIEGGLKKNLKIGNLRFKVLWFFSAGIEYVSGFGKPFLEMIKPGSVLLLSALDGGGMGCSICQIESVPTVNYKKRMGKDKKTLWDLENFLQRGWNSGILLEVEG